jgi:hypothetical protein
MGTPRSVLAALLLTALVPCNAGGQPAQQECATSLAALASLEGWLHRTWRETSMTDGKPLVVSLTEEQGHLHLSFHKTGEGPWARGQARLCRRDGAVEAQLSSVQLGPAAPWLLRHSLGRSPLFVLTRQGSSTLHISAPGWSGSFTASP